MSLLLSFWRPVDIFESRFNKFAAWVTSGEFCHVELVLHVPPEMLKTSLTKAMTLKDQNLHNAIEEGFFNDPAARQALAGTENIYVSFSALWGMQLSARVLRNTATSAWEHTPVEDHEDVLWVDVVDKYDRDAESLEEEQQRLSDYCVFQLGKQYNTWGALISASGAECGFLTNPRSKFCSELCVSALQLHDILPDLRPATVTPNSLYKHIQKWNSKQTKTKDDIEDAELDQYFKETHND